MDESYRTRLGVISHIYFVSGKRMNHVINMPELWHTFRWVMTHHSLCESWPVSLIWVSHDSLHELCHTFRWVMAHTCMSHITYSGESCDASWHTYEWIVSYVWMSHVIHINASFDTCTLQHTATHCKSLQHTNELRYEQKTWMPNMPHTRAAIHCNSLQVIAAHELQHTKELRYK